MTAVYLMIAMVGIGSLHPEPNLLVRKQYVSLEECQIAAQAIVQDHSGYAFCVQGYFKEPNQQSPDHQ